MSKLITIIGKDANGNNVKVDITTSQLYDALVEYCEMTEVRANYFSHENGSFYTLSKFGFKEIKK